MVKPKTRFCWVCSRQLRGNHHVTIIADGHQHDVHKACSTGYPPGYEDEQHFYAGKTKEWVAPRVGENSK